MHLGSSFPTFQMVRVRISKLGIFGVLVEIGELFATAKSVYLLQGKRYPSRKKRELICLFLFCKIRIYPGLSLLDKTHTHWRPEWLQ